MPHRIEIKSKIPDARAEVRKKDIKDMGISGINTVNIVDVYTTGKDFNDEELSSISSMFTQQVVYKAAVDSYLAPDKFDWAVEIGFLPGVKDNAGDTAQESIETLLKTPNNSQQAYSSQVTYLSGNLSRANAETIANNLANGLIESIHIKSYDEFMQDKGMGITVPTVKLDTLPKADIVDIINTSDAELEIIGKQGIVNEDGSRRGPLALRPSYMKAIQSYFIEKGRNPFDIELESIAQTWSEHCKHTIFADPIDELEEGLFNAYIRKATQEIRKKKGTKDFCVSVFTDNAGIIKFDENYNIVFKAETHNSPSALDPFGGAITGIVGVNRDIIGGGKGAKPIINISGPFCNGNPEEEIILYKGKNKTQKMLSSKRLLEGIIDGVQVGGNCSGIPTSHFRLIFDEKYRGKPLVYVGTGGIMPAEINNKPSHLKKAEPGDYIVMVGGKVGKDGIHGATFSSEGMDEGSPVTAVQIGDPITQKKECDMLMEARDLDLYSSITDNGAGGLSCSAAEMAKESGGCEVQLDNVPLKYPGLAPWETLISESQERMTLAVPKHKWQQFSELATRRKVEATIIGEFTDSGKCIVNYNNQTIMDIDMHFLHDGLPKEQLTTIYTQHFHKEPNIPSLDDLTETFHSMLSRHNIASHEFISNQYDHEVQGGSVLKPLQGKGKVCSSATITKPLLNSNKGVVISQGINPSYSDIDTYHMAACAIDTAIRNAVTAGADLEQLAILDNFCWCSSDEPERLGQLKAAARACYDYATAYGTPFISGKDSMFNDFKGYDKDGNPIKISIPPTLLITAIGIIDDIRKSVSLDTQKAGDLVYVLGDTLDFESSGSEYYAMHGEKESKEKPIGNNVPTVDAENNFKLYSAYSTCVKKGLIASAQSVEIGGLAIALAKTAMGGNLGMDISLETISGTINYDDLTLFSETQGRILATVSPENKEGFEKSMQGNSFSQIGIMKEDTSFNIKGLYNQSIINTTIDSMLESYKSTFRGY
ncbi:MAG: AIR synthase-related protein [Candidatus Woesearchaeota archaeon]|nr:AIR synthase-related protein [Candidatus Woesearchaeota archaeon]